jgi:hypothetical protein
MFRNTRIKIAGKFGRLEHFTSRVLGLCLFVLLAYRFFNNQEYLIELGLAVLWLVYWTSHRFEKFFYGRGLRG